MGNTADRLTTIARAAIAALDPASPGWRAGMERAIAQAHTAAALAGTAERLGVRVGGALVSERRLSRAERRDIQAAVAKQLRYLDGFDPADMSEAAAKARAALYAGAVKSTYYEARWGDWELPWVPGDGSSECLGNCMCSAGVKDNGDGTGIYTWSLGGGDAERHCTTCPTRAGDHPIQRRGAGQKAQTAQDRAMFANMGGGGGGGGGGGSGGKPSGGQGGLWAVNPETSKREPGQGLEKGAAPKAGDTAPRGLITDRQLTPDERTSLQWYNSAGHDRINAELRGTAPVRDQSTLDRTTRNLDSAMARSRTQTPLSVYRGTLLETSDAQAMAAQWQPGATFRDAGYVSTTTSRTVAEGFGAGVTPGAGVQSVEMRIRAPSGTPAIYMPTARPLNRTDEHEVLLGRNLEYRVLSRSEDGGRITLDLEVVS